MKEKVASSPKINMRIYRAGVRLFSFYIKFRYKFKQVNENLGEGPFLVIGNHASILDFMFFAKSVYPAPLNAVVTADAFYHPRFGWVMRSYNAIPKRQFSIDLNCIRQIKSFMDAGTSVLLFPEGRVTPDGKTGYIAPSIGKLAKLLGYPVIAGVTSGTYVGDPKWSHRGDGNRRKVPVTLNLRQILSKEDIATLSGDEITSRITEALTHNDNKYLIESGLEIKGRNLAEGLEKLLYKCPKCGADFHNITKGNILSCKECGNSVEYTRMGRLVPFGGSVAFERIDDWYDYQKECVAREVTAPDFKMADKARLYVNNDTARRFVKKGEGMVSLSREGIDFAGKDDCGEAISLHFDIATHSTLASVIGYSFEVSEGKTIYRFDFTEGMFSTKYVLAAEELYKK